MINLVGIAILVYLAVVLLYSLLQRSFSYHSQTQTLDPALASVECLGGSACRDIDVFLAAQQGPPPPTN